MSQEGELHIDENKIKHNNHDDMKTLIDKFANASNSNSLNLQKMIVLYQPSRVESDPEQDFISGQPLTISTFNLGSTTSDEVKLTSSTFGQLHKCLWKIHHVTISEMSGVQSNCTLHAALRS